MLFHSSSSSALFNSIILSTNTRVDYGSNSKLDTFSSNKLFHQTQLYSFLSLTTKKFSAHCECSYRQYQLSYCFRNKTLNLIKYLSLRCVTPKCFTRNDNPPWKMEKNDDMYKLVHLSAFKSGTVKNWIWRKIEELDDERSFGEVSRAWCVVDVKVLICQSYFEARSSFYKFLHR